MPKNKLLLPRVYSDPYGNYPEHKGKFYISYSQYTSWNGINPDMKDTSKEAIRNYVFGLREDAGPYAKFGSQVGEFIETGGVQVGDMLGEDDLDYLGRFIKDYQGANFTFEREVCLEIADGLGCLGIY
jgi:hypothetical protein